MHSNKHIFCLREYMLTKENMIPFYIDNSHKRIHYKPNVDNSKEETFVPNKKDKLFWCFYVILNGEMDYLSKENIHYKLEMNFKIDFVHKIRENKTY